jgi:hypothetical protein
MRDLAKTVARRLPIVRDLLDRQDAVLVASDRALNPLADVASNGSKYRVRAEHSKVATIDDIFYCFRLLLGRTPNPEEWPGH